MNLEKGIKKDWRGGRNAPSVRLCAVKLFVI